MPTRWYRPLANQFGADRLWAYTKVDNDPVAIAPGYLLATITMLFPNCKSI
jgi:hypothetical protein